MKRIIWFVGIVALGLGVLLFPNAQQWFTLRQDHNRALAAAGVDVRASSIVAENSAANTATPQSNPLLAAAQAYNTILVTTNLGAFREADAAADAEYQAQLRPANRTAGLAKADKADPASATNHVGVPDAMGQLSVPKLGIALPIYHGATDDVLALGVGHVYGTSLPVGGPSTHTVLTAHSRPGETGRFNRIDELALGDEFFITAAGQTLRYVVDNVSVVLPDQIEAVGVVPGEDYATLLTCTPAGVNTHRLLVRGVRADAVATAAGTVTPPVLAPVPFPIWAIEFTGGLALAALAAWILNRGVLPKPGRDAALPPARSMTSPLFCAEAPTGTADAASRSHPWLGVKTWLAVPVLVAGLLLGGLTGALAERAYAEPGVVSELAAPPTLPDPGTTGSLTIVKHTGKGEPVAGATFTVQQVLTLGTQSVDLTTKAGWELMQASGIWAPDADAALNLEMSAKAVAQVLARAELGTATAANTDQAGQAVFAGLPVGLYLVKDSSTSGEVAETILVTLPYPDASSGRWLLDAVAMPKPALPILPTPPEPPFVCEPGAEIADLAADIMIDGNNTHYTVGDTVTYDFVVTNSGPGFDGHAKAQITMAPGLRVISDNFPTEFNTETLLWTLPHLAHGETLTLRVRTEVLNAGSHAVTMQISPSCDPNAANNYYDPVITASNPEPARPTPSGPERVTPASPSPTGTPAAATPAPGTQAAAHNPLWKTGVQLVGLAIAAGALVGVFPLLRRKKSPVR